MGRSVAAVAAGFLFVLAGLMASWTAMWFVNPDALPGPAEEDGSPAAPPETLLLLVLLTFLSGLVGGYVSALLAGRREIRHGLVLAALVLAALTLTAFLAQADQVPPWYQFALPFAGGSSSVLGSFLRAWQSRRPPTG